MRLHRSAFLIVALFLAAALCAGLSTPAAAQTVILMHGGDRAHPDDLLLRNRRAFERAGFATTVASTPSEFVAQLRQLKRTGDKVFVVGMSRGVIRAAIALGSGARPDAAVFFSGNYAEVRKRLGSPNAVPPTLVIHHRRDRCRGTDPAHVEPFAAWAGGRIQVKWFDNAGRARRGGPCGAFGAHGFFEADAAPIGTAIAYLRQF